MSEVPRHDDGQPQGTLNALGQPVGLAVPGWQPARLPPRTPLVGRVCTVEPLDPARHAEDLFAANAADRDGRTWTYLPYGPFDSAAVYRDWTAAVCSGDDPIFHAVVVHATGRAAGVAAYQRIHPAIGAIEIGHVHLSPALQGTTAATEALFLLLGRAFDTLGYRRVEWKCDALHAGSRRAAVRLGFTFEGVHRQATLTKGRNRDTAWYSILDTEWPALRTEAFERWLAPGNFDARQQQRVRLGELTAACRARVTR